MVANVFRPGIDPAQLWISIAGTSFFYFSNIFTLSVILDREVQSSEQILERRKHTIDFILSSLRPRGEAV